MHILKHPFFLQLIFSYCQCSHLVTPEHIHKKPSNQKYFLLSLRCRMRRASLTIYKNIVFYHNVLYESKCSRERIRHYHHEVQVSWQHNYHYILNGPIVWQEDYTSCLLVPRLLFHQQILVEHKLLLKLRFDHYWKLKMVLVLSRAQARLRFYRIFICWHRI